MMARRQLLPLLPLLAGALGVAAAAQAGTSSDRPAALLVYPHLRIDQSLGIDTTVQLSNDTDHLVDVRCFYEVYVAQCVGGQTGESCTAEPACSGTCVEQQQRRTPFRVRLTSGQPLAWSARRGLERLPLDGADGTGPDGQSNQSTDIPPLGDGPLVAILRCAVAAGDDLAPMPENALIGLATIARAGDAGARDADAVQYRAIGVAAGTAAANGDDALQLGGTDAEYAPCPLANVLDFFFTGSASPVAAGDGAVVETNLVLVPCSAPADHPGQSVAEFMVYNEFGQRFSTSRAVDGELTTPLAMIDTNDPTRSIFSVNVSGTRAGRAQIRAATSGLHALAFESHRQRADDAVHSAALDVQQAGANADGDQVVFPLACPGDCNHDGEVSIDELITGVGIAIGQNAVDQCRGGDRDHNGQIAINELIGAVSASLEGCPRSVVLPSSTPSATPIETPRPTPSSAGPEITFLGFATADDRILPPDHTDDQGRPVYVFPSGQGVTLVVEAHRGTDGQQVARRTYVPSGEAPDLQLLASRPLGNGDAAVCEDDGARGGIPAVPSLVFSDDPATIAAMNDLGCRAYDRQPGLAVACTRGDERSNALFAFASPASQAQFCIPMARAWALPPGETIIASRLRDLGGTFGDPRQVVVRIEAP